MCICQSKSPNLLPPPFPFGNHKFVFYICDYYFCFVKKVYLYHFLIPHVSQLNSVAQSCGTLCNPMDCSTQGLPVHHRLLEFMSIESVMPSSHLILDHPLLLLPSTFPSIRVFSNESLLRIRLPKYWTFSFNISSSNEYYRLISFRIDWLNLLAVQGTLKSLL